MVEAVKAAVRDLAVAWTSVRDEGKKLHPNGATSDACADVECDGDAAIASASARDGSGRRKWHRKGEVRPDA